MWSWVFLDFSGKHCRTYHHPSWQLKPRIEALAEIFVIELLLFQNLTHFLTCLTKSSNDAGIQGVTLKTIT